MPAEEEGLKKRIPEGLWTKCPGCEQIVYNKELQENLKVCPRCNRHLRLSARERIEQLLEPDSFREHDANLEAVDFLEFSDAIPYSQRIEDSQKKVNMKDAVLTGEGAIGEFPVVIGVLDFHFMGGSMGSVVGERVTRAVELALETEKPLIVISASGGARMQEGVASLMQMAKVSAAIGQLKKEGIPYISILTDPTTGGVTASFAMLGDLIFAEPGALIGFAGPRVIEQTIRQTLPPGFQRAEFLLKHGLIDKVVPRSELKMTLQHCLAFFATSPRRKAKARRK